MAEQYNSNISRTNPFIEWAENCLYDKIESLWASLEPSYERLNKSRKTICEFFRPDMDTDPDSAYDANLLGHSIYEGTAPWAAKVMAIGFQSHQFSKAIDWIDYKMKQFKLRGVDELDQWCQDVRDHMTQVYQRGNFYDVQPKFSLNAITLGSPVNFSEENIETGEIMWIPQHYKTYRLFYDRYNRHEGIIVKNPWTVKQIYDRFCTGYTKEERIEKLSKLSETTIGYLKTGNFAKKVNVIRACFKWDNPLWYGLKGIPLGGQQWYDVYFEEHTKEKDKPLEISGFFVKPFVGWDYDKNNWECASRTPAFEAVYDNVTLQQIFKNYIEDVQNKANPAKFTVDDLRGIVDYSPGAENFLERSQWDYLPKVMDVKGDVRLELEQSKEFEEKLQRHFNTRLFSILTDIALSKNQPLTATQILGITEEKITMISPMLESNDNYLRQVNERSIGIEARAGRGPFAPDILETVSEIIAWYSRNEGISFDMELQPEFIGKLRRAQQMQQRLQPLRMGLAFVNEVQQTLDPDAHLAIRTYDVVDDGLQACNFPMKNMKPKKEYEEVYAQIQEQRAKQAQTENMIEMAKAMKGQQLPMLEGQVQE